MWKLWFFENFLLWNQKVYTNLRQWLKPKVTFSDHASSLWTSFVDMKCIKLLVEISLENNLKVISLGSDRKINIGHIQTGIQIAFYWSWRPQMWTCQTKLGLNKYIPWKPLFSVWCERLCSVGIWNVFVCWEKNASRNLTS